MRRVVMGALLVACATLVGPTAVAESGPYVAPAPAPMCEPAAVEDESACCKICRTGQACGDSCISRDKVCRKGPGCACDG